MANIAFTVIYIVGGIWFLCWLSAWLLQYLLKRTVGVSLKIGKLGVLGFSKLQVAVRTGLTIEIDRVWLSSSFFNPDVRKPLVLCVHDIRIQANVGQEQQQGPEGASQPSRGLPSEGAHARRQGNGGKLVKNILVKVLFFGQFFGVRIQNLTVMLLKTMMPDSLIRMTAAEIGLDITIVNESYVIKSSVTSFLCKALRSVPGETDTQNCLAELSLSLLLEATSDTRQPLLLKTLVTQVLRPQMMLTEGFLHNLPKRRVASQVEVQEDYNDLDDDELYGPDNDTTVPAKLRALKHLRALSFEISELDVKIVRETKQRSLSVSLKHFLTCLSTSLTEQRTLHFDFTLSLQEFLTKSPQAQFAELSKISIKTERICNFQYVQDESITCLANLAKSLGLSSLRDHVEVGVRVYNGFFHYHHEEVQYWSAVLLRVSQGEATPPNRSPRRRGAKRSLVLSWLRGRKTNVVLDMNQLSSALSSVACPGLHLQLSQARLTACLKAAVGVEDMSTFVSALDVTLELEVQSVWCCHLEAKMGDSHMNGHVHHWDHLLYLALLIVKVQKLGGEVRLEAMEDSIQLEWSTKTFDVLSQLVGAVTRPRSTSNHPMHISADLSAALNRQCADQSDQQAVGASNPSSYSDHSTAGCRLGNSDQYSYNNSSSQSGASYNLHPSRSDQSPAFTQSWQPGPSWTEDDEVTKLKTLAKGKKKEEEEEDEGALFWKSLASLHTLVKLDISNISVFVCNSAGVSVCLHINSVKANHSLSQSAMTVDLLKVLYLRYKGNSLSLKKLSEVSSSVLHIHEVKANHIQCKKELRVHILRELTMQWTTSCHMCLLQGVHNAHTLLEKATPNAGEKKERRKQVASDYRSRLAVNILIHADIHLSAALSRGHRLSLHTHSLLVTATLPEVVMEVKNFVIRCDGHDILAVQGFQVDSLLPSHLQLEREAFKGLELPINRGWAVSFDNFDIIFPYKYNFAACYEEVMNTVKWLKMVHKIQKKPFTAASPLPADLNIKIKMLSIEVCDDPFEVKVGLNYELLKDEVLESKKRTEVMDAKLEQLGKTKMIPVSKREELYASLYKKSSEIYIQRWRQMYGSGAMRSQLVTWLMEDMELVALADPSYHGTDNVLNAMTNIDKDSPPPTADMDFATLWCRSVKFSVKSWSVSLRDFPQPMIDITNMHVWGRLIAAEREGSRRAKRECSVEVDAPWGNMEIQRNLPALKFFHDFSSDITSVTLAYGVCWEPAVALYNLALDLISKPSVDPSRPLPFWDKMRLLLHGRLTVAMSRMSWLYHASLDPNNNTELMDWTWSGLLLDWTNGQFVLKGDLDISVRTASKYNESKLLHLPNLRFCVGLQWICLGDPNDHHPVMPYAPDKVPDFSHEEHDSFRAFRSQNLNLDLSLKTKPVPSNARDIPSSPDFYASSLRFLEKIKQCMFSVTRPVRRGNLFGIISPRKPQLTRHYRKIRLTVDFHRFVICHWMSNAKKHGAELVADSFQLRVCNRLVLAPIEDGLCHRPRADWSIKYLTCHLGPTQIYLCKEAAPNESRSGSSAGAPVDKSFFLSVSKISYHRAESRNAKPGQEVDPEQALKTPTHSVAIHEMRGAWNERNRGVVLGLYDSYMKAQALRRNLSSEALKGFKVDSSQHHPHTHHVQRNRSFSLTSSASSVTPDPTSPSPLSKLQMGHAHNMLLKLVSESDSKSVAFTEEPSNCNLVEMLHGVKACQPTNVLSTKWLIELHNSQMMVKGCETTGFVIISAARARIVSYVHLPIWRASQLRSKATWTANVDCMQYYATVDPDKEFSDVNIPWLSRENVEDRSGSGLTGLTEMVSSGQSVGSVVSSTIPATEQSCAGAEQTVQLQRIIHRCSCKFYYANYGDVDPNSLSEVPLPPAEDSDVMTQEEGVDTFTMLHESLHCYSNSSQYTVIMDIVNNLLLYVEPKKKEASEKLQNMRFKLQLSRDEDQKTPILQLQEVVRERIQDLRKLERDFYAAKMSNDEDQMQGLDVEMEEVKNWINAKNEELSMRISCYNESQLQMKAQMKIEKAQQAHVVRRNEVCFKYAKWRLTERDGHCGIAETELRNFVYTKVNRDDNTWTHQLELGWVKMENLLSDNFYQKVLTPRDPLGPHPDHKQMLLRIFCSEAPPVGGIAVKEHFEVNVAPIQIQITYQLYRAVMQFFFPDKNIETDDDDELEGAKKKSDKKNSKKDKEKDKDAVHTSLKKNPSFSSADEIHKMRERAAKNNTFLYIKIPEVQARVSYKGEKDKNIEDVHDFSFVLPTVEYHNCIWTWFDFFIVMKNVSKRVVVPQAIKQKLHIMSRLKEETPVTDVQEEQDKAKMLLGTKLLAGQDKPAKKGFFTKSHKS